MTDWIAILLIILAGIAMLVAQIWLLVVLFRTSKVLFILSILVPPIGQILFLCLHFPIAWKPTLVLAAGIGLIFLGYEMASEDLKHEIDVELQC
ncbi:MAG: hypothetical protein KDM63_11860 [Verrucomicrobiae bacterium]|nr:hypothetical protein [Verrucomicrobiae bacterium]MCB1087734.1 hypothetical protein [Verrucomicrobiae bacterium]MCB1090930.1 hypothetical protein [Verrucomicrobiae bacterium]